MMCVCVCVCVSVMVRNFVDVLYGTSILMCVCMTQGKMNRVFNDVVFNTGRVGKIEGPIKTDFGYHLILIIRRGDETLQDALRQTPRDAVRKAGDGEGVGGFLAENEGKPGVVTLPSGLQYKVLRDGAGMQHPREDTPCECHYEGQLLDGAVFDSSYARGVPRRLPRTRSSRAGPKRCSSWWRVISGRCTFRTSSLTESVEARQAYPPPPRSSL